MKKEEGVTSIYTPKYGGKPDMTHCRAAVRSDYSAAQCQRKPTVDRDGIKYCAQHDPEAVKAREKAREARWKAEAEANERRWKYKQAISRYRDEAISLLREIAAGHSDPRSAAQAFIEREPKE